MAEAEPSSIFFGSSTVRPVIQKEYYRTPGPAYYEASGSGSALLGP